MHTIPELGAEFHGVQVELLRELVAENVLEPRVVLDDLGIQELTAGKASLQYDRFEHGAAGIERGTHSSRSRADDHNIVCERVSHGHNLINAAWPRNRAARVVR